MVKVKLPVLNCNQCGHNWVPRYEEVLVCPKCKSPYWNSDKRIVRKKDKELLVQQAEEH